MGNNLPRRLLAEFIGTLFLLATVVGSGIMGDALSDGNTGLALLANSVATGAILYVLITILGPISGAHFNPAVSMAFLTRRELSGPDFAAYVFAQAFGGIIGVWVAHIMFSNEFLQTSTTVRTGGAQWFAEAVATFGLVFVILMGLRFNKTAIPMLVGLYITAAYWFTASTSFANPAVTVARGLTDTFAGIRPADVPAFVLVQLIFAVFAVLVVHVLTDPEN